MATEFRNDGPHSPDLTRAAADQLAELVRFLNYATMAGNRGLEQPADVYSLLAALCLAAERLPQVLTQAGAFLDGLDDAGRLRSSGKLTVQQMMVYASVEMDYAVTAARTLAARLRSAQDAIADLGGISD